MSDTKNKNKKVQRLSLITNSRGDRATVVTRIILTDVKSEQELLLVEVIFLERVYFRKTKVN